MKTRRNSDEEYMREAKRKKNIKIIFALMMIL